MAKLLNVLIEKKLAEQNREAKYRGYVVDDVKPLNTGGAIIEVSVTGVYLYDTGFKAKIPFEFRVDFDHKRILWGEEILDFDLKGKYDCKIKIVNDGKIDTVDGKIILSKKEVKLQINSGEIVNKWDVNILPIFLKNMGVFDPIIAVYLFAMNTIFDLEQ